MPKQGQKRKKTVTHKQEADGDSNKKVPRCFIVKKGRVGNSLGDLVKDFRTVMSPNTAEALKEKKTNKLRDYVHVANHFNISHIDMFTQTENACYLKIGRLPQGPTLTFKLKEFNLIKDVKGNQKKPRESHVDSLVPPVLVLNGFNVEDQAVKLTAEVLRNMYPAVDVNTFSVKKCRRVAMFNYCKDTETIMFRHYGVIEEEHGLSKGIKKLLRGSGANNQKLKNIKGDVEQFILNGGGVDSDSEVDDSVPVQDTIQARRKLALSNKKNSTKQLGVRLHEIGPRMTLQLVKGEEGLYEGAILFHKFIEKSIEEQDLIARKMLDKQIKEEQKEKEQEEAKEQKKLLQERTKANKDKKMKNLGGDDFGDDDQSSSEEEVKKEKKNPFSWARKSNETIKKDTQKDGTIEFTDSNTQKKKHKEQKKKGNGLKTKKGNGKSGKGNGKKTSVMDKFNKAVKK